VRTPSQDTLWKIALILAALAFALNLLAQQGLIG
jgi:hypothetical protein